MVTTIGVLALQGAVEPHIEKLQSLNVPTRRVRLAADLEGLAGLVLPGGESTAMLRLLEKNNLTAPLQTYVDSRPTWGICAGAILLAKHVSHPEQKSFGAIDIDVERNAYGRQNESFIASLKGSPQIGFAAPGVFIRAPRIVRIEDQTVRVLLRYREEPVLVESDRVLISTFHPELTDDLALHRYFVERISKMPS